MTASLVVDVDALALQSEEPKRLGAAHGAPDCIPVDATGIRGATQAETRLLFALTCRRCVVAKRHNGEAQARTGACNFNFSVTDFANAMQRLKKPR